MRNMSRTKIKNRKKNIYIVKKYIVKKKIYSKK
jgi:hypothetical protein